MNTRRAGNAAIIGFIVLFLYLIAVPALRAEIYYDLSVKGTYEDNVVGLLSDKRGGAGMAYSGGSGMMLRAMGGPGPMGTGGNTPQDVGSQSKGDSSLNLFADIGGSTEIASGISAFLTGSAQHTFYDSFTELDSTIAVLDAGLNKKLGNIVAARIAMSGGIKRYRDSTRDSAAYGPSILFKEQFTPAFWLKEGYYYEKNNADSALFTYTGNSLSIRAGYLIVPKTRLLLGYTYLVRDYQEPAGFTVTANTVSLGVEQALAKRWFLDGQYDHQISDSNVPGTSATDNIVSVGLRYSY